MYVVRAQLVAWVRVNERSTIRWIGRIGECLELARSACERKNICAIGTKKPANLVVWRVFYGGRSKV